MVTKPPERSHAPFLQQGAVEHRTALYERPWLELADRPHLTPTSRDWEGSLQLCTENLETLRGSEEAEP